MRSIVRLLWASGWAACTGCAVYGDSLPAVHDVDGRAGEGGGSGGAVQLPPTGVAGSFTGAGASGGAGQGGNAGTPSLEDGGLSDVIGGAPADATDTDDATHTTADAPIDTGCPNPNLCLLKASLVHRYSFNGTGTTVTDSVGTAHGIVMNAQLSGTGTVVLAGGTTDQYVDLPNGIIKPLTSATFEAWVTWSGGAGWQRIYDFGDSQGVENTRTSAGSSLYLTPHGGGPIVMISSFKRADETVAQETRAYATLALATGVMVEVAVVIDDTNHLMTLYRDGVFENATAFSESLSTLNDINNWLGRSQYLTDSAFAGTIHEFRIYAAGLPQPALQASVAAGPDAPLK